MKLNPVNQALPDPGVKPRKIFIIPVGGCGEFGLNMTIYHNQSLSYIVDCGLKFADKQLLGVDSLIPKIENLCQQIPPIAGYFMTHGHEDHIGALPYMISHAPAPIYATTWTARLIERKCQQLAQSIPSIEIIRENKVVEQLNLSVTWVSINHSIPMASSLYLQFHDTRIFHTGDFKLDQTPVCESPYDAKLLEKIAKQGVDIAIVDSTNAHQQGRCPSEKSIVEPMTQLIDQAIGKAIVTTFSSNLWRLHTIYEICKKLGKKLFVSGRSLENTFAAAEDLKLCAWDKDIFIHPHQLSSCKNDQLVVLASGCQGERLGALARFAYNEHRYLKIKKTDTLLYSARMIPGNEKQILDVFNRLQEKGCSIYQNTSKQSGIHVSGHGYAGDLLSLLQTLQARYILPVHGSFFHLHACKNQLKSHLTRSKWIGAQNGLSHIFLRGELAKTEKSTNLNLSTEYLERSSRSPIRYETLRERLRIGENGLLIIHGVYGLQNETPSHHLKITCFGLDFPRLKGTQHYLRELETELIEKIKTISNKHLTHAENEETLRILARRYLLKIFKRKPVVFVQLFACNSSTSR